MLSKMIARTSRRCSEAGRRRGLGQESDEIPQFADHTQPDPLFSSPSIGSRTLSLTYGFEVAARPASAEVAQIRSSNSPART